MFILDNKIMKTPKQNIFTRQGPIHSLQMDKGKRHYWSNFKSDYGIKQSNDRLFYQRLYEEQNIRKDIISQKQINKQTQGILYHSLKHKNCCNYESEREISDNHKKRLNIDSKNIQIKLPNISRKDIATQSQDVRYYQNLQKYHNNILLKAQSKIRPNKTQIMQDQQRKIRVKTEFNQYTKKSRKIRYSPTYVCSKMNPLPTFKLYNPETQNPVYAYGFNDQNQ